MVALRGKSGRTKHSAAISSLPLGSAEQVTGGACGTRSYVEPLLIAIQGSFGRSQSLALYSWSVPCPRTPCWGPPADHSWPWHSHMVNSAPAATAVHPSTAAHCTGACINSAPAQPAIRPPPHALVCHRGHWCNRCRGPVLTVHLPSLGTVCAHLPYMPATQARTEHEQHGALVPQRSAVEEGLVHDRQCRGLIYHNLRLLSKQQTGETQWGRAGLLPGGPGTH